MIPPIPWFLHLFWNPEHTKNLTWHANERVDDGKLCHHADSSTWKKVDWKWLTFGCELKNLHLGLSADGINPYTSLSNKYSCWPIMLVMYNFLP